MKRMTPKQVKTEMIAGLKNTGSDEVYLAINQVAEVLGIEKAVDLHVPGTLVESQEATRFKRHEGAKAVDKAVVHGMAEFDRTSLLEALEAHEFASEEEANGATPSTPQKTVPTPVLDVPEPEDYDPHQESPE